MKRTPLYDKHLENGGKIIDFNGWELPVQYKGIVEEHMAVRLAVGLFDVSHMGEILIKGRNSTAYIQNIITNDITNMRDFQIMYSPICYKDGGVVDDLLIYKYNEHKYLIIVNASNIEKDYDWMQSNAKGEITIENVSENYSQLALQGPKAQSVLQKLTSFNLAEMKFFNFNPEIDICGIKAIVSRTGYTGEDGFELYVKPETAAILWNMLLAEGKDEGIVPVGLGARDTLRFEAALPLYGHEISQSITPLEARLDKFVKLDKVDFIGRDSLVQQKEKGLLRLLVGFEMIDRGIPRSHFEVRDGSKVIGFVTTGSYSPSLKKNIGMAIVDVNYATEDTLFEIIIRDKAIKARVTKLPFYSKKYKK